MRAQRQRKSSSSTRPLELGDVYAVIGYYLHNRADVEQYLERRLEEASRVRRENEARFDPKGIRERLLARRH
jgi:hypothetical protein